MFLGAFLVLLALVLLVLVAAVITLVVVLALVPVRRRISAPNRPAAH